VKVFVSWSGGKDCMLACYRTLQQPEMEVAFLLNMLAENGECSLSHNLPAELLREQAGMLVPIPINLRSEEIGAIPTAVHQNKIKVGMGIPILQCKASREGYEKNSSERSRI
jgi:diphthamide synthase (EF-2-diphthine--ammonia ligase)